MASFPSKIRIRIGLIVALFIFVIYLGFGIYHKERDPHSQTDGHEWMTRYVCDQIPEGVQVGEVIDRGGFGASRVAVLFSFTNNEQAEAMVASGNFVEMSNANKELVKRILNRYKLRSYEYTVYQKSKGASTNIIAIDYNSKKGVFYYAPN